MKMQFPSVILPTVAPTGTETELIADILNHTSLEFDTHILEYKQVRIVATEVVAVGAPGPLWCWIELSPFLTTVSPLYWAAIGGGGGGLPPVAPAILVGTGVNLTAHTLMLPWNIYSPYARLVVQTPVLAAGESWLVQAIFDGG